MCRHRGVLLLDYLRLLYGLNISTLDGLFRTRNDLLTAALLARKGRTLDTLLLACSGRMERALRLIITGLTTGLLIAIVCRNAGALLIRMLACLLDVIIRLL